MALQGFDSFSFNHGGARRTVYARGRGPAVVVMHEIPGITPQVEEFARRVADEGFRVYLPNLFGTPGKPISAGYVLGQMGRACISREFSVVARQESRPMTDWRGAVFAHAGGEWGGPR